MPNTEGMMKKRSVYNLLTRTLLHLMAWQFNHRSSLKPCLACTDGWINFSVGFRTETGSVEQAIIFHDGRVEVTGRIPPDVDVTMRCAGDETFGDAMANPALYRNLLVRISGYNACFVTLNRDMQLELIERAEYGL